VIPYRNSTETLSIYKRQKTETGDQTGEGDRDQNHTDTKTLSASFLKNQSDLDSSKSRKSGFIGKVSFALEKEKAAPIRTPPTPNTPLMMEEVR
jgi:hypothetical protein